MIMTTVSNDDSESESAVGGPDLRVSESRAESGLVTVLIPTGPWPGGHGGRNHHDVTVIIDTVTGESRGERLARHGVQVQVLLNPEISTHFKFVPKFISF